MLVCIMVPGLQATLGWSLLLCLEAGLTLVLLTSPGVHEIRSTQNERWALDSGRKWIQRPSLALVQLD